MKIVIISAYYTEGMGYSENCLPKTLASLGHEVHLITSIFNIYGTSEIYKNTYETFIGPSRVTAGKFKSDSYTIHRLNARVINGYVCHIGLYSKIKELSPDIVHSLEIASFQSFIAALIKPFFNYKLFTESHQHMSIVKPFLKKTNEFSIKKVLYRLTRTFPTYLASIAVEKCYAIAPDCAFVANNHYGVPNYKIKLQGLGTDTDLFHPAVTVSEFRSRSDLRKNFNYSDTDIVCIYTGRFSEDKNPLLLAKAIDILSQKNSSFHGLFIGSGIQITEINKCKNVKTLSFIKYVELSQFYQMSDIAIWPTQESMSMLDAAASGLPLIVSNRIGQFDRIEGNGLVYDEGDLNSLIQSLESLFSKEIRNEYGKIGREKMLKNYSWSTVGQNMISDFSHSINNN
jgi:glycosyltransferase involved in cell wall biosynthesis